MDEMGEACGFRLNILQKKLCLLLLKHPFMHMRPKGKLVIIKFKSSRKKVNNIRVEEIKPLEKKM